ncbi:hypothetical protein [Aliidiomarina minuta]|uniref:hypothetical protein n=1 Tax=Aliidiomarina minuta TaxID=880057 RepID=UPI0018E599C5|nr:hypothetical protein [Aliidiomarina minuta]
MSSVLLEDGRSIALQGLYVAPIISIQSPLVDGLGLALQETPMGTLAITSGTMAGIAAHRALMF